MNNWNIPEWLEEKVYNRDKSYIYCGIEMKDSAKREESRKDVATWEHIINDASIITEENIARCCNSCNASKGSKKLSDWIKSSYCKKKNINYETVPATIQKALDKEI